uniref:Uncharacterized protein n=1 Tax=Anguilla anguilla TaxID=7936 RepID=A0A0E9VAU9_ANGAN
MPHVNGKVQKQ